MSRSRPLDVRRARCLGAVLLTVTLVNCGRTSPPTDEELNAAAAQVSAKHFRAHMTALATDAMQGRETGTPGYLLAADYVAGRFAEYGLTPLGDDGSYFQKVPFLSTRLDPGSARLEFRRAGEGLVFAFGEDFVTYGSLGPVQETVTAPLVFVGYGIHAPQHGRDDFAGVESHGKILVRLTGAPPAFPTDERAFFSAGWVKDRFAVEHGAVGVITVRTPVDLPRLPWDRLVSAVGSSGMHWTDPQGLPFETFPQLRGAAMLSEAGAARLFAFAGQDLEAVFAGLDNGETHSFELGLEASLYRSSIQETKIAPNVIGMVPGRDSGLRMEYLLFSAHLDHLGVRSGDAGDDIYNGAYDNAAGVAAILEVARVIADRPGLAGRSVAFAALTGEEKGLQGSSYLAHHPPFPIEQLVAVINVDMPYLGFPIAEIMGLGAEHSSLQRALATAAERAGLEYIPDPRPELVRFIRSDQFSFVRRGVPGLNLKAGARSADPAVDGEALHEAYLQDHYHRPSDDLDLSFSPQGSERLTRAALLLGLDVANAGRRPEWNVGDFFADQFASDRADGQASAWP